MSAAASYRDPAETVGTYSAAEHPGRVKTDVGLIAAVLSDGGYTCETRLDTADPQLATVRSDTERAQIEFDTARARWVASGSAEEAEERSGGRTHPPRRTDSSAPHRDPGVAAGVTGERLARAELVR